MGSDEVRSIVGEIYDKMIEEVRKTGRFSDDQLAKMSGWATSGEQKSGDDLLAILEDEGKSDETEAT